MSDIVTDLKGYSHSLRDDGPLFGLLSRAIKEIEGLRSFAGVVWTMEGDFREITKDLKRSELKEAAQ